MFSFRIANPMSNLSKLDQSDLRQIYRVITYATFLDNMFVKNGTASSVFVKFSAINLQCSLNKGVL